MTVINLFLAHYGSVGDIEILFTVLASVGAAFSIFSTVEAIRDYGAITSAGISNGRRLLAWTSVHSETARLIIQLIFLTLGVLAMFLPEVPPQIHLPTLQFVFGEVFRWGLITASGLLMYKSILSHVVRQHLRRERLEKQAVYEREMDDIRDEAAKHDPLTEPINPPEIKSGC